MPASIGVNLRVTGHCRQGGRKYMEDYFTVAYQQTDDEKDLEYAFFGIYDGHGGAEAAVFAKEHLMETIIRNKNFWSDDDEDVLRAIKEGYVTTHYAMWKEQEKWPKTASGLPSTAGTTASVAFIRRGKIYIGHVGDSGIILGYQDPDSNEWLAKPLTRDHKPENAEEISRIKSCGGKVVAKSGVPRVVWNRPRIGHKGPVRRSTPIDEIPFLAVARSLGDLWSYNSALDRFVVSPDPDCAVVKIDTSSHRCLIFGTDGLFNMLSPQTAVTIVRQAEKHNEQAALSDYNKAWLNPSKLLVERALERWHITKMRADNTSVITLMLDPPGPPKVLKLRKKASLPDSGLEIMTRYEEGACSSCPEPETSSSTNLEEQQQQKSQCLAEPAAVTSSDCNLPLKERNFVPKTRESTSFDPRGSPDVSVGDKENQQLQQQQQSADDSIQINEISSSSSDEGEAPVEVTKHNLRSSSVRLNNSQSKEGVKRKASSDEGVVVPRKSLRLGPPPDNKATPPPRLTITQKILKSKKMTFKKQQQQQQLSKENLERAFKEVLKKPVAKKGGDKVDLPKFLREVRATVLGGKFQRRSMRRQSQRRKRTEEPGTSAMATRASDKKSPAATKKTQQPKRRSLKRQIQQKTANLRKHVIKRK